MIPLGSIDSVHRIDISSFSRVVFSKLVNKVGDRGGSYVALLHGGQLIRWATWLLDTYRATSARVDYLAWEKSPARTEHE